MEACGCKLVPNQEVLLKIIKIQSEIVKLGLDLGDVIKFVAEQVQYLTNAQGTVVELVEGMEMVYRAATGLAAPQLGLRIRREGSLSGLCIDAKEVLVCEDCEEDARVDKEACRKVGLRSMVVTPLYCNDAVVGVLKIVSPAANYFTAEQICIVQLMSELIAASMFYAAKYEITELYYQATHDAMTGLANRALFYDHLRQSLALANRRATLVGILNLDMDGLKAINDQFGHRAGDAAIQEMAKRINGTARKSDTVARLGGDEFGVLLPEIREKNCIEQLAERMVRAITLPFEFESRPLKIDASIGMAVFPEDAGGLEALVEKADQAMYNVKRARKQGPGR